MDVGIQPGRDSVVEKAIDDVVQNTALQGTVAERSAGNILAVDTGKVHDDLTGIGIAEHVPRLAFVGDAPVCVETKTVLPQYFRRAAEIGQFVVGPSLLARVCRSCGAHSFDHRSDPRLASCGCTIPRELRDVLFCRPHPIIASYGGHHKKNLVQVSHVR